MRDSGAPCRDCDEREVGCHSHCMAYKVWKAGHILEAQKVAEKRAEQAAGVTTRGYKQIRRRKGER